MQRILDAASRRAPRLPLEAARALALARLTTEARPAVAS